MPAFRNSTSHPPATRPAQINYPSCSPPAGGDLCSAVMFKCQSNREEEDVVKKNTWKVGSAQEPSQSSRQASSDLQICPRCGAEGAPAGALFPLLPIPIINPLLPDESIRFPRPDAQRSTYMIDSIENAVFFSPRSSIMVQSAP